ncbi:argininosuccinate lyase [Gemmatimonadota bacterium]
MGEKLWEKGGQENGPDKQVEAFTVGNDHLIDTHILVDDCWASIAHAAGLAQAGILTAAELVRLQSALLKLIERHEREGIAIDRSHEDCHTAIEMALTAELGDLGKKIHTGRSRNDQVLTALRIFAKRRMLEVGGALQNTISRLLERARSGLKVPMRGYSHTRPAMPTTLAVWLGGFVELLLGDVTMLRAAYDLNDRSPLGSAAGFGSSIPLNREFTQQMLGFSGMQVNALSCQTSRGKVEGAVVQALAGVQETLDTLARDMILYSTDEFGFLSLPEELTTGSSIMPQKRNPDVLELVRGKTGVIAGLATQVRAVGSGLYSGYHRDYQLLKEPLINTLDIVEFCLQMMARLAADVVFDEQAMRASCTREIYAADIAMDKAQQGVPFRDAYQAAMAELDSATIDDAFVTARIDAYRTIGSMGNPGLDRYEEPLSNLAAWVAAEQASLANTFARLRGPLTV